MAKRQNSGKITPKPAPIAAPEPDFDGLGELPDAIAYIQGLGDTGGGIEWNIRVYKIEGQGRGVKSAQAFLFEVEPQQLPELETNLAHQYPAGGSFKVVVRADNQIRKSVMMDIAPRPGYKPPPPAYLTVPQTEQHAPQQNGMDIFFQRMMEMQRAADERMEKLLVAIARPATPPPSFTDELENFSKFQAMLPKGAAESSIDQFQKGMDFAKSIYENVGSDRGGSSWSDIALEALKSPVVKDILAAAAAAAPAAVAALPHQPAAQPGVTTLQNMPPVNTLVANAIDTLLRQAQAGVDPKIIAPQVAANVPADFMEELEEQPDAVAFIIHNFPQFGPHRAWLAALVAEVFDDAQDETGQSPALKTNAPPGQLPQA